MSVQACFQFVKRCAASASLLLLTAAAAMARHAPETEGGEANLKLPDLSQVNFLGVDGHKLLLFGILFCVFGLAFGLTIYQRLKNLPVHRAMREISELIYETCKTYLITQGKFILLLEAFIAVVIVLGSAYASTPSRTRGPHLPACAASLTRFTRFLSRPG
jgi:K(+)-stimulated pyrophosphate-energized sodium pump